MITPEFAKRRDEVMAKIADNVRTYGQSIMVVGADKELNRTQFGYTIGRANRGLPELILIGPFSPKLIHGLLTDLDKAMPEARPHGAFASIGGAFPVKLLDVTIAARADYTSAAERYHRQRGVPDYRVQQMVLCDEQGRFPPEGDKPWCDMPLLPVDSPIDPRLITDNLG